MRLSKVLVPIDFSPESRNALLYARAFSRRSGASLTVLHVVEPILCQADYGYGPVGRQYPNQELLNKARAKLNKLCKRVTDIEHVPMAFVRSGMADAEIVQTARDLNIDLIVMGTRGASREPTATTSICEMVVRSAPCPVYIVRQKEHEFAWCRKAKR